MLSDAGDEDQRCRVWKLPEALIQGLISRKVKPIRCSIDQLPDRYQDRANADGAGQKLDIRS